ncbi:MAG: hypothetical protein M9918_13560, partial [Anaerolineae bacterium]|nr:hypothetical protein [Anaerolineae bacterium]
YGRVTNGGQVMSGYAVSQTEGGDIEFRVYQNPEVYEAYPTSEALTEALNRVVFDLLYETLVGNKLRNQQDYELKRDWAFPQQSGNPPLFEVRREVSGWGQVRRVAGILRDVLAPPLCHNSSDQAGGHLAAI